ncbi:MAG: S9 family peptidase [Candidatus Krumholzibacteria bacterium]|nr:S9 family peptidase [Candidatus Krumholzibacteria bacterium]
MRFCHEEFLIGLCVVVFSFGLARGEELQQHIQPPVARVVPKKLEKHGKVRVDNYYWLNQREDSEVIAYLEAENEYTNAIMSHTEELQDSLFAEIKGRIKQTDESVPFKLDEYYYYTRYEDGKEYPIYCRKKGSLDGSEEIMLDVNEMAKDHEYFWVRGRKVSSGQNLLAYAEDSVGRRIYTIKFKNLDSGETLKDVIPEVTGGMAWANDNRTLFYAKQDPTTLRSYQIYRHVLGSDQSQDALVYEEKDETFSAYVWKTKSKKFVMIGSFQTLSSEYRFLDANDANGSFSVFLPRERDHEYSVDHYQDRFYVRTNYKAKNFRLMETPLAKTDKKHWTEVIPHRDDVLLEGFEIFEDYLVVEERKRGLIQMRIRPWSGQKEHYLDFGEPTYLAYIGRNPEFKTDLLRFVYSSMTTPRSTYDYNMVTRDKSLLKQDEVLGGFDSDNYETERLYARAKDGVEVPISMVYRKGVERNGENPLVLYGYGSYGYSLDASFSAPRLSLIDRGFVYAIAHVRGGEELGRRWYEDGKLLKKKNTFTDFIACAQHLIKEKYTNPDKLFAMGGSAGGLLMGAIMNMRPDLFEGIVTRVPFVDVITTMLDESIPLTTSEYDEWGNPNKEEYYDYIMSYSPYDNVAAKDYPNLLVTTGLHDSQVQYWEPAKWVAKLRATKTGNSRLLLKTNMDAGHGGASGRYHRYRETAFQYAFLLDLVGYSERVQPSP